MDKSNSIIVELQSLTAAEAVHKIVEAVGAHEVMKIVTGYQDINLLEYYYDPHAWVCNNCGRITQDVNMGILKSLAVICPACHSDAVMPDATRIIINLTNEIKLLRQELNKAHGIISDLITEAE